MLHVVYTFYTAILLPCGFKMFWIIDLERSQNFRCIKHFKAVSKFMNEVEKEEIILHCCIVEAQFTLKCTISELKNWNYWTKNFYESLLCGFAGEFYDHWMENNILTAVLPLKQLALPLTSVFVFQQCQWKFLFDFTLWQLFVFIALHCWFHFDNITSSVCFEIQCLCNQKNFTFRWFFEFAN